MRLRIYIGWLVCAVLVVSATAIRLAPRVEAQTFTFVQARTATAVLTTGTNALSTAEEPLRATLVAWECLVQNDPDNTVDILVGNSTASTGQTIQLSPGQSITIPVQDAATIWLKSVSATPTANYICR